MSESFEEKLKNYQQKHDQHLQNWKKIRALVNFSKTVEDFTEWETLEFIIRFYKKGFLWETQEKLLDEILAHYKIDYLQWAVKNAWVKMQTLSGNKCKTGSLQIELPFFDLDKKIIETRERMPIYSKLEPYKMYHKEIA